MRFSLFSFLYEIGFISGERYEREVEREVKRMGQSWRLSGFTANNLDAGVIDIGHMTRREALRECAKLNPNAAIIHVDDEYHIITYRQAR